ncbi:hypothetical protein LSH36_1g12005 [Paralvinella palmiformis]|uniref:alpha-L-fucosidase n=1 Tax=Paralvinella palmiformis TaxID=53620 RepID=A0AAD9NKN7_9ANNE|nr:hypothetical protein LSH36_1g12005 [Paralvinella palmiformis]
MINHLPVYLVALSALVCWTPVIGSGHYEPNWDSLDKRPIPAWYDEAKFGIFIHWGVYSVPAFGSEWFWNKWEQKLKPYVNFMKRNYPPGFTYADFAPHFTAEFYDPDHWVDIFENSGAKYVVLTSKHHEGFTNWPSNVSFNWNSMDVGPKRDLVGELAVAIRKKKDLHFGLYHSLFEWFNPLFLKDKANHFQTRYFPVEKSIPELYELVTTYKPDVVWSDGAHTNWTYWKSPEFLAWLYNDSPVKDTVVTNDRWGDVMCKHGDFWTCHDRYNPGHLLPHKWENCMPIDTGSWGFRRNTDLSSYLTIEEIITILVETISCGGNLLMNVGPTHDGRIIPIFEERLWQVGRWLKVNGEAIYGTKPWTHQNDTLTKQLWYTSKKNSAGSVDVYAITLAWPNKGLLRLGAATATAQTQVTLLGYPEPVNYKQESSGLLIYAPLIPTSVMPCQWGWTFKLTNLKQKYPYQQFDF